MATTSQITRTDIIALNRQMIEATGGLFTGKDNLENSVALDYILEAVQSLVFGVDQYPTVVDKAAAIGYHIMTRHIFHDGCKRTGLIACAVMLEQNGYELDLSDMEAAEEFTLATADSKVTLEEFTGWIRQRSIEISA